MNIILFKSRYIRLNSVEVRSQIILDQILVLLFKIVIFDEKFVGLVFFFVSEFENSGFEGDNIRKWFWGFQYLVRVFIIMIL